MAERRKMMRMQPSTARRRRFMGIAEQMGKVLQRTSISVNIKERLDFSCAMFGPDGSLVKPALLNLLQPPSVKSPAALVILQSSSYTTTLAVLPQRGHHSVSPLQYKLFSLRSAAGFGKGGLIARPHSPLISAESTALN